MGGDKEAQTAMTTLAQSYEQALMEVSLDVAKLDFGHLNARRETAVVR